MYGRQQTGSTPAWLEHPGVRRALVWSWPVALACAVLSFSTGWIWRHEWLALLIPAVPLALWFVAGGASWARASGSVPLGVARVWLLGHIGGALAIEAVNVVFGERWLLVSRDWPPPSASLGALGALYLAGSAFVVPWAHCFVARAMVAFRRRALSTRVEVGLVLALVGWLGAGGVMSLLMSAA